MLEILKDRQSIILKPTIDSKGGSGIMLFNYVDGHWMSGDIELTEDFLYGYGNDFALQEIVKQHDDLARFNQSSVNTIRIAVYKSVQDDRARVTASYIRIGSSGMVVDNASSGGKYIGIDVITGKLSKYCCDVRRRISTTQNGIDFSKEDFFIPGWELIKSKCVNIAEAIPHHRLFAFDMTITNEMKPIMIEFNVASFSYAPFMTVNQAPLGEYKEEIIEHCKKILGRH